MARTKPKLVESKPEDWRARWDALTAEQRKQMSAAELKEAMGALHVSHPDYKSRPYTLVPMPNLAGKQPVIAKTDCSVVGQFRQMLAWAMR